MRCLINIGKMSHFLVTALVLSSSLATLSDSDEKKNSDERKTRNTSVTTSVISTSIATVQDQAITISNGVVFNVDIRYDPVKLAFGTPYMFMLTGENVKTADLGELILVLARAEIELYNRDRTKREVISWFVTRVASTHNCRSSSDNNTILVLREAYSAREEPRSMLCHSSDFNTQSVSTTSLPTSDLDYRVIPTRGLVVHMIDLEPFDLSLAQYDRLLETRGA